MGTLNTDKAWKYYGNQNPYFGVIGTEEYLNENLNEQMIDDFFASGNKYVEELFGIINTKIDPAFKAERILDFGCGPGPALSVMMEQQGRQMDLYDPFYYNDPSVFDKKYDFICATEVVEHLHNPNKEFAALFKMLRQNGWLGIMTKLVIDENAFKKWHYIRDMTHICFYGRSTFEYLAQRFNAEIDFVANDVILFNKK